MLSPAVVPGFFFFDAMPPQLAHLDVSALQQLRASLGRVTALHLAAAAASREPSHRGAEARDAALAPARHTPILATATA